MTTEERLIEAAGGLLDAGGLEAVTLRAVGQATGLSHNAPYKHFSNRNALLAAVATASFKELARSLNDVRSSHHRPSVKMMAALQTFMDYSRDHQARYRLLFINADIAGAGGELKLSAMATFEQFRAVVIECQKEKLLPETEPGALSVLIFATAQGLLAMEANGQLHAEKGLSGSMSSLELLLDLLKPA